MDNEKIKALVSRLSLEEKAGLCAGGDFWHTKAVERLGIPEVMLTDGPFGLRKQAGDAADMLGINESVPAVCFPAGVSAACSFDRDLMYKLGMVLGEECQAENIGVLLGPAMNIKRSPLCGRNFEYYSEDPYLSSELAAAYVEGLQEKGIAACPKHFYGNNMENRRMTASSEMDERTKREIYLACFEGMVKKAAPRTIMAAYNKINGIYACENEEALTDILREEWGFDGLVVSDWTAVNDRVRDLTAGMDLEMPGPSEANEEKLLAAVRSGAVAETVLDTACARILELVFYYMEHHKEDTEFNLQRDHQAARKMEEECIVLLKNNGILPLREEQKVAVIGKYAVEPRFQGGGSSHINNFRIDSAWDILSRNPMVRYAKGFNDQYDSPEPELLAEAVAMAEESDVAVLFVGLPDLYESEGYDRKHMRLPEKQNHLIEEICKVQDHVVIVLHNGSPVEMPWIDRVDAILEAYLGGQAVGSVQADVLYGRVNPSGHLAESFPVHLEDNPSYLSFCAKKDKVQYTEGVFVGYRYYTSKKQKVLFPFGHGLSYTEFACADLRVDQERIKDTDQLRVFVDVSNTGLVAGKAVVQIYISPAECEVVRPIRELKEFAKVELRPGETKTISFVLEKKAFAYWETEIHDWFVPDGDYIIEAGFSCEDIRASRKVYVESTGAYHLKYTPDSAIGDIIKNPKKAEMVQARLKEVQKAMGNTSVAGSSDAAITPELVAAMMSSMPLRSLFGTASDRTLESFLIQLNT